ncbi:conserved hypothetical protein [Trichinella spiralis]|uniref:hypothetical protein n=1 Tax=Trichinella spiralis TaxID=6334 RepID=UPI0001EFB679|nr:conserved hypothetical protein [Trichinella spiralis]
MNRGTEGEHPQSKYLKEKANKKNEKIHCQIGDVTDQTLKEVKGYAMNCYAIEPMLLLRNYAMRSDPMKTRSSVPIDGLEQVVDNLAGHIPDELQLLLDWFEDSYVVVKIVEVLRCGQCIAELPLKTIASTTTQKLLTAG